MFSQGNVLAKKESESLSGAWSDHALTPAYIAWRRLEEQTLSNILNPSDVLLDYCCGDGRVIPLALEKCSAYLGCDTDAESVGIAKQCALSYGNRAKITLQDWELYSKTNPTPAPTMACCLGNTCGALQGELNHIIHQMAKSVSGEVFISVIAKGNLNIRQEYYELLKQPFRIDQTTETIYSPTWGATRAFSKEELLDYTAKARVELISIDQITSLGFGLRVKGLKS